MTRKEKKDKEKLVSRLREKYRIFKRIPFPHDDSDSDELSGIHTELALEDTFISGSVASCIGHAPIDKKLLHINEDINKRLAEFKPKTEDERIVKKKYINYKSMLDDMMRVLQELVD